MSTPTTRIQRAQRDLEEAKKISADLGDVCDRAEQAEAQGRSRLILANRAFDEALNSGLDGKSLMDRRSAVQRAELEVESLRRRAEAARNLSRQAMEHVPQVEASLFALKRRGVALRAHYLTLESRRHHQLAELNTVSDKCEQFRMAMRQTDEELLATKDEMAAIGAGFD